MKIYEFSDYKMYINRRIELMPKRGRGQFKKLSELLNVNSVVISQIFKGSRELSLEQANVISTYFGMNELEKEYFFLLVQKGRTSDHQLAKYYDQKLEKIKIEAHDLKNIVQSERLSEETQSLFYSNWYYSAIRLSILLKGRETPDKIANKLGLSITVVQKVISFLLQNNLIIENNGKLEIGPQRTHIEASSPFVNRHHINWRLKGFENMENLTPDELFYTSPMTLSKSGVKEIKKLLLQFIQEKSAIVADAQNETLACLNIDLFELN